MKNRRLLPLLVGATLVSAFGLSSLPVASAQPGAPAKAGRKPRTKGMRGGVPKKMMEKIETEMGKPLTAEQKDKLNAAYKARAEAQKAAVAKFNEEVATVTGLTADQVTALTKRGAPKARAGAAG